MPATVVRRAAGVDRLRELVGPPLSRLPEAVRAGVRHDHAAPAARVAMRAAGPPRS